MKKSQSITDQLQLIPKTITSIAILQNNRETINNSTNDSYLQYYQQMIENKRDERMKNDPKCKIFIDKDNLNKQRNTTTDVSSIPNSIRARNREILNKQIQFQDYGFIDK